MSSLGIDVVIRGIESVVESIPFILLEIWGRFSYLSGFALALAAFGGFTFRLGHRWGFGRERQAWDAKAILSIPLTFALIVTTGYLGSFVVLVPEAQTFESIKDLMVFLCVVLFGYPALLTVPFAYGLSDLVEGVPPGFLLDWLPGYFINPACFWIAYQLIGKEPDFRRARTWRRYLIFVALFLGIEPVLWGHICASKFGAEVSYRNIAPALFFTTGLTWIAAPIAMLAALPLARRLGLFWAEIPGHVEERGIGQDEPAWRAGEGEGGAAPRRAAGPAGWPLRVVILAPFIALVFAMVTATAFVALRSAETDANKLAVRLHEAVSKNIDLLLDEHFDRSRNGDWGALEVMLKSLPIARHGLALIVDASGRTVAGSAGPDDPVALLAIAAFAQERPSPERLKAGFEFRFHRVTEKPLNRETYLARVTAYEDRRGGHSAWRTLTVFPESYYLAGVQAGTSRTAMVVAAALLLSLGVAALLAALVTRGLRGLSEAARSLAEGESPPRASGSSVVELDALASLFNDMAERLKRSIDGLRTGEARYRALFERAPEGILIADGGGVYLDANAGICRMLGYSRRELIGKNGSDIVVEREASFVGPALEEIKTAEHHREWVFRRKDGSEFPAEVTAAAMPDGNIMAMIRDITERRRSEAEIARSAEEREALRDQLTQSQKMESVGQLAGGVAHDFNNILSAIIGFAELVRVDVTNERQRADLDEIMAASQRAVRLTRQLLAFSRKQILQPQVLDLNASVTAVAGMLRRLIGENVELLTRLNGEPCPVEADPGQIEQVLLNLAINARDAMPKGGRLTFETTLLPAEASPRHLGLPPGPLVRLSVQDTGCGMTEAVRARIFEPFFTTKDPGKGTGLGLSTVYGIVTQSGGVIEARSAPGQGASFDIYLPQALQSAAEERKDAGTGAAARGHETILVAEDEEPLRRLVQRVLEGHGYSVASAPDGESALAALRGRGKPVDLLITDVVMPRMSGRELSRAVASAGLARRTLFVSGYAIVDHGVLEPGLTLLQKPFTPEALLRRVREVLDGPADASRA